MKLTHYLFGLAIVAVITLGAMALLPKMGIGDPSVGECLAQRISHRPLASERDAIIARCVAERRKARAE